MKRDDVINKLIRPYKTNLPKEKVMKKALHSKTGTRSSFMINTYGCEKCLIRDNCSYYPHANGICARRSKMYIDYFKQGKDDTIPLMIDQLAKISAECDIELEKGIQLGSMTEDFFRLSSLKMLLQEKINKATQGTKVKVEHSWFDEMRTINTEANVIEVEEDGTIKQDSNNGEPGTERGLLEEVKRSREVSRRVQDNKQGMEKKTD